jgi:hypothetical protein
MSILRLTGQSALFWEEALQSQAQADESCDLILRRGGLNLSVSWRLVLRVPLISGLIRWAKVLCVALTLRHSSLQVATTAMKTWWFWVCQVWAHP